MSTYEVVVNGSYSGEGYGLIYHKSKNGTESTCRMDVSGSKYLNFTVPTGNVVSARISGTIYSNADIDGFFTSDYGRITGSFPQLVYRGIGKTDRKTISWSGTTTLSVENSFTPSSGSSVSVNVSPEMGTIYIKPQFTDSQFVINEKCGDISTSIVAKMYVVMEHTDPTLTNLSSIGQFWEQPISINWRSDNQVSYEYELYYNNVKISNGTGGTEKQFTIPAKTFTGTLPASVRVRTINTRPDGVVVYSNWSELNITLKDIEATISNLLVNGDMWEKPISLSWLSENQDQFKIEVLKDNVVVKTYTGTTAKNYTIAANELSDGVHAFKVWVGYQNRYVNNATRELTLKNVIPTLDNVSVSGSNIDLQLALSWVSTDQEKYEVQILKSDAVVKTYTGTTATSLNIPPSTLTTGVHIFKVRVAYKDRWTDWKTTQVTLTETLPSIGVLEPDGRIVDRDTAINVYWTSQNQTSWELRVGANTYTGTNETSKLLPIGLLSTGRQSMTLTVTLAIAGKNKLTAKTVEFIVQGKPPVPTFTNSAIFTTNRPTFTWDSQDCQAYELSCGEYSTGWVNGLVNTCKIAEYLQNGQYTAKLRVKNQYNIASDYSTQQITINAAAITPTTLRVYNNDTSNTLKWDMTGYASAYVIRNGERIALAYGEYVDNTCQGENIYQILCVTAAEVATLSNKVVSYNTIDFPVISDGVDMLELIYRTSRNDIKANYSTMSSKQYYSGRKLPITRHGEHEERTYSFDYAELGEENFFRLLEMVARKKPLLYRSHNKKLWLTFESISYNDNVDNVIYSINAYEVDMSEVVDYE